MKRVAVIMIGLVLVIGAGCSRRVAPFSTVVQDSSRVTVTHTERDTMITVPADSAKVTVVVSNIERLMQQQSADGKSLPKVVMSRSGRSSVTMAAHGDTLTATANCDYYIEALKLRDQTIEYLHSRNETTTKEVPVRYIPWWAKVLSVLGGVALFLIILRIVLQFIKLPI